MTVKLSERAEELVKAQLDAGYFSSPEEAVAFAIAEHFMPALSYEEVEAALLAAVREPTVPHHPGMLVQLVEEVIAKEGRK